MSLLKAPALGHTVYVAVVAPSPFYTAGVIRRRHGCFMLYE